MRNKFPFIPFIPFAIGGFNINYSFIFYLFRYPVYSFRNQPVFFHLFILQALFSLFISIIFINPINGDIHAQLISFFSYLSVGFLLIIKLPYDVEDIFLGLKYIAFIYSFYACIIFVINPDFNFINFAYAKLAMSNYVPGWPQRFTLMICLSLIHTISIVKKSKFDFISILIMSSCLIITFTRSIYLSILFPIFMLASKSYYKSIFIFIKNLRLKLSFFLVPLSIIVSIIIFMNTENSFVMLVDNIFILFKDFLSGNSRIQVGSGGSSEGERLFRWIEAFKIFVQYPLFGTGFRGIYQFSEMGSIHSQYFDVLMRTGLTGMAIHVYLLYNIYINYHRKHFFIFPFILCIMIFGIFNESVKQIFVAYLIFMLNNKSVINNSMKT